MNYIEKIQTKSLELDREKEGLPLLEKYEWINIDDLLELKPFSWWVNSIDNKFWLIDYNRFIIIAGEWWAWKTTFTMQQAMVNAKIWNKVAYMSLEMWKKWIIEQTARKRACIPIQIKHWKKIIVSEKQKRLFNEIVFELENTNNLNIIWYDTSLEFNAFLKELEQLAKVNDLIFIDNIWMLWRWEKEIEFLPKITEALIKIKRKYKVTIIALHHLNKRAENQKWPRNWSALRWSWKLRDDVDILAILTRWDWETVFTLDKSRFEWNEWSMEIFFEDWKFLWDIFN